MNEFSLVENILNRNLSKYKDNDDRFAFIYTLGNTLLYLLKTDVIENNEFENTNKIFDWCKKNSKDMNKK